MQTDLLKEKSIFSSAELQDMESCNHGLWNWYASPRPGKLLFLILRIHNIGK